MQIIKKIFVFFYFLTMVGNLWCQEGIDIFGYFQVDLTQIEESLHVENSAFNIETTYEDSRNSFMVQQANLFFRKDINADLTAWINFEIKNSFSSEHGWGYFNLEEAWIKYNHNAKFKIKAGLLLPEFNNLLQVRNRTPYLPYIMRPLVYETSVSDLFNVGDFFPEKAYVQVYGKFPTQKLQLEYAAFVGNSEKDFISNESFYPIRTGEDTTAYLMTGGRFGISKGKFKAGVSYTHDRDNQHADGLGAVPRWRIGTDLSFSYKGFWFEGELISVQHDINQSKAKLNKLFYYATLGYDFSEQLYVYSTYNYVADDSVPELQNGTDGIFIGGGFRPNDALVLKTQFTRILVHNAKLSANEIVPVPLDLDYDFNVFSIAMSVFF